MPRAPVGAPREPIARRRHRSRSPPQTLYATEVPQPAGLRHQLLRVAQAQDPPVENDDSMHQDDDAEGLPLPKTPRSHLQIKPIRRNISNFLPVILP